MECIKPLVDANMGQDQWNMIHRNCESIMGDLVFKDPKQGILTFDYLKNTRIIECKSVIIDVWL